MCLKLIIDFSYIKPTCIFIFLPKKFNLSKFINDELIVLSNLFKSLGNEATNRFILLKELTK
jgi:hypothetical protein